MGPPYLRCENCDSQFLKYNYEKFKTNFVDVN